MASWACQTIGNGTGAEVASNRAGWPPEVSWAVCRFEGWAAPVPGDAGPLAIVHTNRGAFPEVTVTVAVPVIVPSTVSVAVITWSPSVMSVTPPGKTTVPASATVNV